MDLKEHQQGYRKEGELGWVAGREGLCFAPFATKLLYIFQRTHIHVSLCHLANKRLLTLVP